MAPTPSVPLNVLVVEDRPDDADLLILELRRAGYSPRWRRVDTEPGFLTALAAGYAPGEPWDLVLSDFQMPGFSGARALTLLQQSPFDLPFILISGTIGEEYAVEAMQGGASDYLVKGRLARLRNAVSHALEENRLRLQNRSAERAQRASEQRFRGLIENSADGIGVVGRDGRLNYLSPASLRILGYTPEQMTGGNPFGYVHPDDLATVRAVIRDVLRAPGQARETEYRLRHASGAWRTIRTSVTNLLDEPSVAGIVFNYRDVTAQKVDEQAVRASEGRYRALFEGSPVALWEEDFSLVKQRLDALRLAGHTDLAAYLGDHPQVVSECAALVRVIDVNTQALRLYRAASKLELQNSLSQILIGAALASYREELLRMAAGQTDFQLETPLQALNGETLYVTVRWSALPGYEHSLARVIVSVMDITERVRAEQALRASEERYRGVFEGSPIALLEQDFSDVKAYLDGLRLEGITDWAAYFDAHPQAVADCAARVKILATNPSARQLYGGGRPDAYAGGFQQIVGAQVNAGFRASLVKIAQGETRFEIEAVQRTPAGREMHINLRWSALPGREQSLARVIVSAMDVTERRVAEAELKRHVSELEAINRVSVALRSTQTQADILLRLLDESLAILAASAGSLWLLEPSGDTVRLVHEHGWAMRPEPLKLGQGIPGRVVASGQALELDDASTDARVPEHLRANIPPGRAGLCVPIRAADQVIGALFINLDPPRRFAPGDAALLTTLAEMAGNAVQRARLYEQAEQQLSRMTALRSVDQAISSSLDLRVTLNVLLDQAITQLSADAADVLLLNPHRQVLEFAVGRGHRGGEAQHVRMRLGEGRAGRAAYERRTLSVADLRAETGADPAAAVAAAEGYVAYYGVPLLAKGQIKGVLEIYHRQPLEANQDWLDFLESLAGQAAIAIDNANLFDGLQRSNLELTLAYDATIAGWSRALDLRDHESEGHTERVTDLAVRLAAAVGVGEGDLVHVRRGARLHDIGNMGVSTNILLKPGPLSEADWAVVRQHPAYAYELLAPIPYLRPALDIAYNHHERWDGQGYPRGLKGDTIPLSARIFAVADTWDAMRSARPYRPALPAEQVLAHIRAQAGQQFDPRVVAAFLALDPDDL